MMAWQATSRRPAGEFLSSVSETEKSCKYVHASRALFLASSVAGMVSREVMFIRKQ